jgi:hypothetical protein
MWGTEHEGFVSSPAWYSEAMYVASSGLQRHLMDKTTNPIDRNHVIGHNEWKNANWKTWMAANYSSVDTTCNTHSDPGVYWNWSHFMDLISGAPPAPSGLKLTPVSTTQIKLSWTDNSTNETGFKIERALSSGGTWSQIATTAANVVAYTNGSLSASTVYFYRLRSYNGNGNSDYSSIKSATTGNSAPVLAAIGDKTVVEGATLAFTATTTDTGGTTTTTFNDFEGSSSGTLSYMFQKPSYSGSSRGVDTAVTNYSQVTSTFPAGSGHGNLVLKCNWAFIATPTNWVRLTTASAGGFPNPTIDLRQILKFDIYSEKALKVGIGVRETGVAASTAIGADGGTTNGIEWVGVTNAVSGQPFPTRTVAANTWTTLRFILPQEPARAFAGSTADGDLTSPTGMGVLEHLAFVPTTSSAVTNNVYLDNFSVIYSNILTYSLDPGAPAGASINPITGAFTWKPTEAQGPGAYDVTIRVTDNGTPPLDDSETITIIVSETNNAAPTLTAIANQTVLAGNTLTFTNTASDTDVPLDLTFSLDPGAPPGADVNPSTGVFAWTPPLDAPSSTNSITVRVTDGGPPEMSATRSFNVCVVSRMASYSPPDGNGNTSISWNTLAGHKYRVQYKTDLNDATWTDATGDIPGDGTQKSQSFSVIEGQRFYRIVEVP